MVLVGYSTITGMGRGPGNLNWGNLKNDKKNTDHERKPKKIMRYFKKLKKSINGVQINITRCCKK